MQYTIYSDLIYCSMLIDSYQAELDLRLYPYSVISVEIEYNDAENSLYLINHSSEFHKLMKIWVDHFQFPSSVSFNKECSIEIKPFCTFVLYIPAHRQLISVILNLDQTGTCFNPLSYSIGKFTSFSKKILLHIWKWTRIYYTLKLM
jgi:hypothetical protein